MRCPRIYARRVGRALGRAATASGCAMAKAPNRKPRPAAIRDRAQRIAPHRIARILHGIDSHVLGAVELLAGFARHVGGEIAHILADVPCGLGGLARRSANWRLVDRFRWCSSSHCPSLVLVSSGHARRETSWGMSRTNLPRGRMFRTEAAAQDPLSPRGEGWGEGEINLIDRVQSPLTRPQSGRPLPEGERRSKRHRQGQRPISPRRGGAASPSDRRAPCRHWRRA